jgi:hypothetical protein
MLLFTVIIGLAGAGVAMIAATRSARDAGRYPAPAFGLSAFVIAILTFGAALQTLVLHVHTGGLLGDTLGPPVVYAAFAAAACVFAAGLGFVLVALWIRLTGRAGAETGRLKTSGLAVLFSLAITILAAPFLIQNQITIERSVEANLAEIAAFKQSYTNGLEKLTKLGALSRIEVDDEAVTHYIGGPLYKIGEDGLAEYARAAMIYHTQVLGHEALPVVLRDAATQTKIGTYRTDSVYVVHADIPATPSEPAKLR